MSSTNTGALNLISKSELIEWLDNRIDDCYYTIHDSPTKGTLAVVYFYDGPLTKFFRVD